MEETYKTKAIILKRESFREYDSRVTVFSLEKGKLDLIARGTKKISSKLAGHLEPLNFSDLMVVRGKQFDYVGSARAENCFWNIKSNLEKINQAGNILKILDRAVEIGERDENIFNLILNNLHSADNREIDCGLLPSFFSFRLLALLGYKPDLYSCANCKKKLQPGNNFLNFHHNGLLCGNCALNNKVKKISDDCIKVLRLILEQDFEYLLKLKISDNLEVETKEVVSSFLQIRD